MLSHLLHVWGSAEVVLVFTAGILLVEEAHSPQVAGSSLVALVLTAGVLLEEAQALQV